jgi:DNA-binding NtrC family response regulator
LLVDDDLVVLRALKRLLLAARPGWEIDSADSAEAAMQLVQNNGYDVVVTDLHMPQSGGLALLERLKAEQPAVMRVIHSSHVESLSAEQAQELAHAILRKPGRPDEPLLILDWALDQRRRRLRDSVG